MIENQRNTFVFGCLLVSLANMFIGINIILTKYLVSFSSMAMLLGLRYFFAVILLASICLVSKKNFSFYLTNETYSKREKLIYLIMALSGGLIFNAIYTLGLKGTSAIATGMIGSTIPLLIVLLSFVFLKQKIVTSHILSALLVSLGIIILTLGTPKLHTIQTTNSLISNFIVFMAMIPEAMFTIFAKMLSKPVCPLGSALRINIINFTFCAPFFFYSLSSESLIKMTPTFVFISFLTGLCIACFYSFYNSGISKINAQTAGLLTGVVPISTTFFSIIFLNEYFGLYSFIGLCFVLFSIYIGVKSTTPRALQ